MRQARLDWFARLACVRVAFELELREIRDACYTGDDALLNLGASNSIDEYTSCLNTSQVYNVHKRAKHKLLINCLVLKNDRPF